MRGIVDIASITFEDPKLFALPPNILSFFSSSESVRDPAAIDKSKKNFVNLSRECVLEDVVVEWYDQAYSYK